jgi:hypothetical protein
MNRKTVISLLILISLTFLLADNWKEYCKIQEDFYKVDRNPFNTIECKIEVKLITDLLESLKVQLAPYKDNLEFEDNLDEFKFIYSKEYGIKFEKPTLKITIISEENISDVNLVNQGIQQMEAGFTQTVDGACQQIDGFFADLIQTKQDEINVAEITINDNCKEIKYTNEDGSSVETIKDNIITTVTISKLGKIDSKSYYQKTSNNKLIIETTEVSIKNSGFEMDLSVNLTYLKLEDNIILPSKITSNFVQKIQAIEQKGVIEIVMFDWVIK